MNAARLSLFGLGAILLLTAGEVRSHGLWIEPGAAGCKVFFGEPEHGLREKQDKLGRFLTLKGWKADGSETNPELKEDHILLAAKGKAAPALFLDLVPEGDGSLRFHALKGGKPYGSAQVDVLAQNGWSRQVEADKDGMVEIPAPWPGLYVLKVSLKDKTPGEFKGKRYETASHNLAVSFVKPLTRPLPPGTYGN